MIKSLFKIAITSLLVTYLLVYVVDLKGVVNNVEGTKWSYYFLAYLISLIGIILKALRWKAILNAKAISLKYIDLLSYYFIGIFYNNVIPGAVGGDTIKMYKVSKEKHRNRTYLVTSVIVDRYIGLIVVYFTGIIVFMLKHHEYDIEFKIPFVSILIGYACIITVFSSKRIFDVLFNSIANRMKIPSKLQMRINEIYDSLNVIKELSANRKEAIKIFLPSMVFFFCAYIGEVFVLLYALDCPITYFCLLSFMPILNLIVMLPISFGGLGVREYMLVYFLGQEDVSSEIALSLGILMLSLLILNSLIGAGINMIKD